jgi:hypothetical protein
MFASSSSVSLRNSFQSPTIYSLLFPARQ